MHGGIAQRHDFCVGPARAFGVAPTYDNSVGGNNASHRGVWQRQVPGIASDLKSLIDHYKVLSKLDQRGMTARQGSVPSGGSNKPVVGQKPRRRLFPATLATMKIRQTGFTLIELLIVVALVAVLASIGVPSFRTFLVKRTVQATADALMTDLRYARSEAVKRSAQVSVCLSANGTSCLAAGGSWSDGWIVFVDGDGDGVVDAGDEIVRVQQSFPSMASIASTNPSSDRRFFTYQPTGWAKNAGQTFIFTPKGDVPAGTVRVVCISNQGRAGLKAVGATSCA